MSNNSNNVDVSINTNFNKPDNTINTNELRFVTVLGMTFDTYKEEVPDFGSIRLVGSNGQNAYQYLLNSEDVPKLGLLTNAGDGSLAYCLDDKTLYAKHEDTWKEV